MIKFLLGGLKCYPIKGLDVGGGTLGVRKKWVKFNLEGLKCYEIRILLLALCNCTTNGAPVTDVTVIAILATTNSV